MTGKIIKKYPKTRLETCGQRKTKYLPSHKKGCYLRLTNEEINHTEEYCGGVILDFNKNGEMRGIEFVDGLK